MADDDEFKERLARVDALYHEVLALRKGTKDGVAPGNEELVLAELRLDNAWRELYEFMDLPLSRIEGAADSPD